jgi:hypothetical protein
VPAYRDLDQRWRLLVPAQSVVLGSDSRRAVVADVEALPSGTSVTLVGGRRLRGLARRSGLRVLAEYVALPSLATPVAITQVEPGPLRWAARTVLTVPSGVSRWHAPVWYAVRLVKVFPRLMSRAPAGDRLLVGERP